MRKVDKKFSRNTKRTEFPYIPTFHSVIIYNWVTKQWVELDPKLDLELIDHWNL